MTKLEDNLLNIDVQEIRDNIPILKDIISFNSGMDGPLPKPTIEAINKSFETQYKLGTFSQNGIKIFFEELVEAKITISSFLKCKPSNICLTPNTTFGINLAINAFNWNENDEIITSKEEHPSALFPLYNLRERYKTKLKLIEIDPENAIDLISKNISKNTKAIVLSHVFYESGNMIHSLKEIIDLCRSQNIVSIIDGAQAAGAIDLDLDKLKPDFYAGPGQKWLMGPCGTGFLYMNERLFDKRPPWPSIVGFNSAAFSKKGASLGYVFL